MNKTNILILLMCIFLGVGIVQCDSDNNDISIDTPPADWIIDTWRSEYNDSIKFINDTLVYINSLYHYYKFDKDSIKISYMCYPDDYSSYKYEFNIEMDQFMLYGFSNKYIIYNIYYYDSLFYLNNPDSTLITKCDERTGLSFEEWIQGLWKNQKGNILFFTRPIVNIDENELYWCKDFIKDCIYYFPAGCSIDRYVFTKDSLRITPIHFSNLNAYVTYAYELQIEDDQLLLYNFNQLDTAIFNKIK